jgi:hypothetical protein
MIIHHICIRHKASMDTALYKAMSDPSIPPASDIPNPTHPLARTAMANWIVVLLFNYLPEQCGTVSITNSAATSILS